MTYWSKKGSKCLVFDSKDENKKVLTKYIERWDVIKNEIKTITGGKEGEYGKNFMKMKFNFDDNLPLNKLLKLHLLPIVVRSVSEKVDEYYLQIYLDECVWVIKMIQYEKIDLSERIDNNKTIASK